MSLFLIDSDILIDIDRQFPPALRWIQCLTEYPPISGVTSLELCFGASSKDRLRKVRALIRPFPVIWPSATDMRLVLADYPDLNLRHGIGLLDALIAVTAIGHGLDLATFNSKHFSQIPGIKIIEPYTRAAS